MVCIVRDGPLPSLLHWECLEEAPPRSGASSLAQGRRLGRRLFYCTPLGPWGGPFGGLSALPQMQGTNEDPSISQFLRL